MKSHCCIEVYRRCTHFLVKIESDCDEPYPMVCHRFDKQYYIIVLKPTLKVCIPKLSFVVKLCVDLKNVSNRVLNQIYVMPYALSSFISRSKSFPPVIDLTQSKTVFI